MALKFLSGIDLVKNEILNARLQNLASAPDSPLDGLIYYNSTDHKIYYYANSAWVDISNKVLTADDIPTITLAKISDAGTAASKNTGTASGNVPILDSSGKLSTSILPAIAISDTFVVASEVAMLAVTAEVGDIAIRTDLKKSYILKTAGASTLANWQELLTPTDTVTSVAGKTGVVTLAKADVGLSLVDNTADSSKAVLSATKLATTRAIALSGDVTGAVNFDGSAGVSIATTLTNSGATAGTYKSVTVDAKGRVTGGTNPTTLSGYGITDAAKKYTTTVGDGSSTSIVVTHNLNSRSVVVSLHESASPYEEVLTDVQKTSVNTITLIFAVAPTAGQYTVTVVG